MYLVFAGDNYYPCGGFKDFKGEFESLTAAFRYIAITPCEWYHVVEYESKAIVEYGVRQSD